MKNKEEYLKNLEKLIEQTYLVENEFKQLKELTHQVIEFLPNPLWVLDKNGEFFLMNSEAKNLSSLYSKIDQNKNEYEIVDNDKIYLIKIKKTDQNTIISATDITKQKREERLASMGQVSAHLAHEIRNPIGSISILASTLLNRVSLKDKLLVMEIKKAIYRVERIIKTTLLFTKGINPKKEKFKLKKLKNDILNSFEYYSVTKDIDLKIDFNTEKEIFGDFDLLSIVFQNFLYNALDAIEEDEKENGKVDFLYKEEKNFDIFIIKDSGIPIKDKNILYEPFKTTKLKGHGLGLALSLEIIKAHQGKIELLDKEKGFKIFIKKEY